MILGSGETPSVSADRYENLGFLQWMHWSDGRGVGWGHCDPKLVRPHYLREDLVLAQSDVYSRVDEVFQQGFDRFAVEERGFSAESMVQRSEEHTSELQSLTNLVCRLLLEKK